MSKTTIFYSLVVNFFSENPEKQTSVLSKLSAKIKFDIAYQDEQSLSLEILCYGEDEFNYIQNLCRRVAKAHNMNILCENIPL